MFLGERNNLGAHLLARAHTEVPVLVGGVCRTGVQYRHARHRCRLGAHLLARAHTEVPVLVGGVCRTGVQYRYVQYRHARATVRLTPGADPDIAVRCQSEPPMATASAQVTIHTTNLRKRSFQTSS
ncbi:Hypp8752 [Branchiostoma lanceolatum]|uniref:Hypp8752 protein n=1 Tax=Branchiostoma lanceolatum TaxID=7740 RepID=A0A8J9ZB79_BRALA|nr:Hypp8752 [Branchiostoma lanceolatum]